MTRRELLLSAAATVRRRPNVLLVMPDQLRAQALGCMGDPNVRTPHLDRLASEGLLLRNMVATTPVCCPARAIILTGRYAHRNGMVANDLRLRESEVTLSSVLRQAGYRTGFIGKWHLDGGPRMPGFIPPGPRRHGFEFWAANECNHAHFNTQYFRDSDQPIPMNKFEAEGWTDLAIEFLRGHRSDSRPFFLSVQMGPPHDPYKAPPEYSKRYDAGTLRLRANYREGPVPRSAIAEYYAMITAVDDQVGRLVAELDSLGMAEDTIVLFTSDHGDMLGSQGQRLKRKPWEESIRVPGIIRYPRRVKAGRRTEGFFTHVDIAPTVLGLCGAGIPKSMQGADLTRLVSGSTERGPDEAFLQIFGPYHGDGTEAGWRGVRTSRYTYARYADKPWVLYDNHRDPDQLENRIGDRALVARLESRVAAWMKRTGDSWSYNWTHPVEDGGRLYRTRAYYTVDEYLRTAELP
jgi:arylsulfatase A-like enzyme